MRHQESRRRQKLRVKSALMVVLCPALILVFLNGCRSNANHGELISTSLSLSAYTEARERANPGAQASMYYFPTLEILNDAGVLVYRSHESIANAQILKDFPRSVRSLPPQEDAPRLAKILEQIPDFKPREQEIVGKKRDVQSRSKPLVISRAVYCNKNLLRFWKLRWPIPESTVLSCCRLS